MFQKSTYLCNVFFIVLDLRLTRLGYSGIPFFMPISQWNTNCCCFSSRFFMPSSGYRCLILHQNRSIRLTKRNFRETLLFDNPSSKRKTNVRAFQHFFALAKQKFCSILLQNSTFSVLTTTKELFFFSFLPTSRTCLSVSSLIALAGRLIAPADSLIAVADAIRKTTRRKGWIFGLAYWCGKVSHAWMVKSKKNINYSTFANSYPPCKQERKRRKPSACHRCQRQTFSVWLHFMEKYE